MRIAIRFFFMGLAVGILLAPRSGAETRRMVRERADRILNDVLDAATLGTYDDGTASQAADADAADDAPKSRNGRGRSGRATSTASTPA